MKQPLLRALLTLAAVGAIGCSAGEPTPLTSAAVEAALAAPEGRKVQGAAA